MSRLALIPPLSLADSVLEHDDQYYMYLPEQMQKKETGSNHPLFMNTSDDVYGRYIWRTRTDLAYTILDNGAFEGMTLTTGNLLSLAKEIGVNEIIIPDVLGSTDGTLQLLEEFTNEIASHPVQEFQYMAVAQGTTFDDVE